MKVLFAGLGSIGQRHLRNLQSLRGDQVEVLAYRTRRADLVLTDQLAVESESGLEGRYGIRVFSDLEEALSQHPEVVFVTNPSSLHIPVAMAAARAGAHLFIEKPLSNSMEGVSALIDLVEQKGLVGFVGYQLRFHPALQQIQQWVSRGAIGRLLAVRAEVGEYLPGFHAYEDYRRTYAARSDMGGGVVLSQIHELDYLQALFGMPERVFALGGKLSSLEIDVEDVASTLLEMRQPDGRFLPMHLHQDYIQRPAIRACQIIGERGKVLWDYHSGTLQQFDAEGQLQAALDFSDLPRNQLFLDEMRHFLECLEGKQQPIVSLREAARSLIIARAILGSLQTGQPVRIDDIQWKY